MTTKRTNLYSKLFGSEENEIINNKLIILIYISVKSQGAQIERAGVGVYKIYVLRITQEFQGAVFYIDVQI